MAAIIRVTTKYLADNDLYDFTGIIDSHIDKVKEVKEQTPTLKGAGFDCNQIQNQLNSLSEKTIFFIIGCPKSGTTWLQRMLDSHPNSICRGEADFNLLIDQLEKMCNDYNRHLAQVNNQIGTKEHIAFTRENLQLIYQ